MTGCSGSIKSNTTLSRRSGSVGTRSASLLQLRAARPYLYKQAIECKQDVATYAARPSYAERFSETCQPRLCPVAFRIRPARSIAVETVLSAVDRLLTMV